MEIYQLVVCVDKHQDGHFTCSDVICDFLYPSSDLSNLRLGLVCFLMIPLKAANPVGRGG